MEQKTNSLIHKEIKLEIKLENNENNTQYKNCFICNDMYLKLYESIQNNKFLSLSSINNYEYKSYYLTLKIPPILTIRDFYIIHHLHYNIKQSIEIIILPNYDNINDNYCSHKDLIHFMIENLSKQLNIINNNTENDNNNEIRNKFGYTSNDQVDTFGINITFNFYHNFILNHIQTSQLNNNNKNKHKIMTKQAKKRDKFRKWKNRTNKKNNNNTHENTNCFEYEFIKTFIAKEWRQKHHYLNSIKLFLMDLESITILINICKNISSNSYLQYTLLPWIYTINNIDIEIKINRPPIFIAGEYNKYSREISQTPFAFAKSSILTLIVSQMRQWNNNNKIKIKCELKENNNNNNDIEMNDKCKILNPHSDSNGWINIKQNICDDINNIFCCDDVIFHSAGREDMNVRMLGKGRPLLLQLINPRKTVSLCDNDDNNKLKLFEIFCNNNWGNNMIKINNIRIVNESYQEWMKSIENTKNKLYRCLCWVSKCIENQIELDKIFMENNILYPLELKQWTPIRVLHRRSLNERIKKLYDVKLKWIDKQWISVDILSEAGTYIKEFCHGDRGRTIPNLASLLKCNNVNIIQLDVIAVLT